MMANTTLAPRGGGATCLVADGGVSCAPVRLSAAEFDARIPEISGTFSRHFTRCASHSPEVPSGGRSP
jgi:hypothetical protein